MMSSSTWDAEGGRPNIYVFGRKTVLLLKRHYDSTGYDLLVTASQWIYMYESDMIFVIDVS